VPAPRTLEIAEWRMNLSPGYRFEATQALRQVLHRAVAWGMIDVNPAKVGVDNPVRRRKEQHPFESWIELETVAAAIGPKYGPMILFAAATGLRPAEWIALDGGQYASSPAPGAGARRARPKHEQRLAAAVPG
jgi:integrase